MPRGKPLAPHEEQARQLVEAYLGVPVVQHDDNTKPADPDLRIEYADRPHAVMEIVRDADRRRVELLANVAKRGEVPAPARLRASWNVMVAEDARISTVVATIGDLLLYAEQQRLPATFRARRGSTDDTFAALLAGSGVDTISAYPPNPATGPEITLIAPARGYHVGGWDALNAWLDDVFAREPDVPAKLLRSKFPERHAMIVTTFAGNFDIFAALLGDRSGMDLPALPVEPPQLPDGVDAVWIWGPSRLIAWLPDTGWVNSA